MMKFSEIWINCTWNADDKAIPWTASTSERSKMTGWVHWGFSKIFFLDHFSPSFLGQKYYFFITYSILTGQTKVEFVIYWVLIWVLSGTLLKLLVCGTSNIFLTLSYLLYPLRSDFVSFFCQIVAILCCHWSSIFTCGKIWTMSILIE